MQIHYPKFPKKYRLARIILDDFFISIIILLYLYPRYRTGINNATRKVVSLRLKC
jgi:hypothetical protein